MELVVCKTVLGEKSADEFSNHRLRSSLTVPLEGATPLRRRQRPSLQAHVGPPVYRLQRLIGPSLLTCKWVPPQVHAELPRALSLWRIDPCMATS